MTKPDFGSEIVMNVYFDKFNLLSSLLSEPLTVHENVGGDSYLKVENKHKLFVAVTLIWTFGRTSAVMGLPVLGGKTLAKTSHDG